MELNFGFAILLEIAILVQGCHYYRVAEERKKRDITNHVTDTIELRSYMSRCMDAQFSGDTSFDWNSNVDFTILDSAWFENTELVYCSAASGLATRECWQEQIKNFLVDGQGGVLSKSQTCISEYAEDRNFRPPRDRYAHRRIKRQLTSPGSLSGAFSGRPSDGEQENLRGNIARFANCLADHGFSFEDRAPLNYSAISLFIEQHTKDERSNSQIPIKWQLRSVALTKGNSPLRAILKKCAFSDITGSFWSSWSGWGNCSSSCGIGMQIRRRSCRSRRNPFQISGGCGVRSGFQARSCLSPPCSPQRSSYAWSPWIVGPCSHTCGEGVQVWSRTCIMDSSVEVPPNLCMLHGAADVHQSRRCFVRRCENWFAASFGAFDDLFDDD